MDECNLKILNNPKSLTAEAFRSLRTNIKFVSTNKLIKTILFTSTGQDEGKSSVVANLAISISQSGKRVLVIDADLRNPSQHRFFKLPNFIGLSTILADNLPILDDILKNPYEGLDVLTAGPIPPNPAELLESQCMRRILQESAKDYDLVLIDSPPVIAVADASVLAHYTDGVILVVAERRAKREYALNAKVQLEKVGANMLGLVVNKAKLVTDRRGYYYAYHTGEAAKAY